MDVSLFLQNVATSSAASASVIPLKMLVPARLVGKRSTTNGITPFIYEVYSAAQERWRDRQTAWLDSPHSLPQNLWVSCLQFPEFKRLSESMPDDIIRSFVSNLFFDLFVISSLLWGWTRGPSQTRVSSSAPLGWRGSELGARESAPLATHQPVGPGFPALGPHVAYGLARTVELRIVPPASFRNLHVCQEVSPSPSFLPAASL